MRFYQLRRLWLLIPLLLILTPMSSASISVDQSPSLVIYTYDSLLADPGYAFDRAFEVYAGLPNGSVQVNYLSDTGTILSRAIAEKNNPVADVLIGIDNVLVHQAREENILTPYIPDGAEQLIDGLVDDLASDYLLTPYDYGVIALWYLNQEFEGDLDTEEFSLDQLLTEEFRSQLIVQDPRLSSPGLGFLLTSIALYGDDSDGILEGSWQDFWRSLSQETAITSSWGDAITRLYAEEDRTMMVSYTSSPAYGNCLWEDDTTTAVLPTVDGVQYGWQQIEGIGLVNNAPHTDLAMDFIDWFISEELQEQIHLNQWVYPARDGISAPDCYNTSIDPSTITPLNSLLSPDTVEQQLDMWLTDWEVSWIEGPVSSNDGLPINWIAALLLIPILRRRNKV